MTVEQAYQMQRVRAGQETDNHYAALNKDNALNPAFNDQHAIYSSKYHLIAAHLISCREFSQRPDPSVQHYTETFHKAILELESQRARSCEEAPTIKVHCSEQSGRPKK